VYELSVKLNFSAAHNLRKLKGKCEALHGHNYKVEILVSSKELTEEGIVMDFGDLKSALKEVLEKLDHKYLNEIPPFDKEEPSCENLAKFITNELLRHITSNVVIKKVTVWESEDTSASYLPTP